ncbi:MAG: ribonuclease HI family protein [Desulfobulbus sp.]
MARSDALREMVLLRLAQHLDDAVLRRLVPEMAPAQVRSLIAGALPEKERPPKEPPVAGSAQPTETCRLFTDGASRGNPGLAGAGVVLLNGAGEELAAFSFFLGVCTNNVAEYKALLLGLDQALERRCMRLDLFLDSELIVRQIQGVYKVKNETLLLLYRQVQERLDRLERWSVHHVPRSQNARADQLANQGIDSRSR